MVYLDQPSKEKDECDEVEVGPPAWEAVNSAVHDEDPALLRGSLVHCEYAGSCERERERRPRCEIIPVPPNWASQCTDTKMQT